ncbi:uncharacterized protein [Zea mays]|uniref:uncharacterized protein n=1 Tax=Zea mays TaxID=4577 RepID=UPI0016522EBD|nr:uncharacterized protein LOC103641694 [Zea mays]
MVIISESEKEKLKDRARRLLSKPIKFFNEMQELFLDSSADGSLAMDATTCLNESQPVDDNDNDDDICNDVSNYGQPEDDLGVTLTLYHLLKFHLKLSIRAHLALESSVQEEMPYQSKEM